MSVNGNGRGNEIWGAARLVAPAVVALVLAGVALPLILDSGTARLPAVGLSIGTDSGSALAPVEKIVVTTPSKRSSGAQHHSSQSAASAASTPSTPATTGSSSLVSSQAATSPVVHPTHQSPAAANRTATSAKAVTKPSSGSQTPKATPKAPASTAGQDNHGDHGARGRALGHQDHSPPGQAHKDSRQAYEKSAPGHRDHVPPGQARKHSESRGHSGDHQGQDSQGDDNDEQGQDSHGHQGDTPPGHADGSNGADTHGRGHGH